MVSPATVLIPMRFSEAERGDIEDLIVDPDWVLEQKMDGTRGMAIIKREAGRFSVFWTGGGAAALKHTAATQWFTLLDAVLEGLVSECTDCQIVLDGEIMIDTGEYRVFDVPFAQYGAIAAVRPDDSLVDRRSFLEQIVGPSLIDTQISIVRQAKTEAEKRALYEAVHAAGGEGVMAKHVDNTYRAGERVRDILKVKFVKTADVIVTSVVRGRNPETGRETGSIGFAVLNERGGMIPLGNCSAIGKPPVEVGNVIEVAYLSYFGGALVQPRMTRVRTDKPMAECDLGQLVMSSREAVR